MKQIAIAFSCVFILFVLNSCTSQGDLTKAQDAISQGALIVDARSAAEFDRGHIGGALLVPHDQMESRYQELLPYKDKPIVLYCRSGRRSGVAKQILEKNGFSKVINAGGYRDLKEVLDQK